MTDRLNGFVVTLNRPIRDDDAEAIRQAILIIKGVLSVDPLVSEPNDWAVATRTQNAIETRIRDALKHDY